MKAINWRNYLLGIAVLSFAASSALAATSNCKNPTEVTLRGTIKMKFCEVPAVKGVHIGIEYAEIENSPFYDIKDFQSFQIGQFIVTQQQYKTVTSFKPPWMENGKAKGNVQEANDNPAVYVSYYLAEHFVGVMNLLDPSATYRLPTSAELEYAAGNFYWFPPALDAKCPRYCTNDSGPMMDISSDVWQWTADAPSIFGNANGNMAVAGDERSDRVIKRWYTNAQYKRLSHDYYLSPSSRNDSLGIRLVRTPK